MSDDWAKRTFEKIQRAGEEQRRKEELEMQRAGRISGGAPRVWEFLIEAIKQKASELNTHFRENVPLYADNSRHYLEVRVKSNLEAEVRKEAPPSPASLHLTFDHSLPSIKYSINKYTGYSGGGGSTVQGGYQFMISGDEVCLCQERVAKPLRLEEEAERLLSETLQ